MEKRKSAANIFMEQQAMPSTESFNIQEEDTLVDSFDKPLFSKIAKGEPQPMQEKAKKKSRNINFVDLKTSEELQLEKEPIKVRITGFGIWQRVIVPPNVYVIHTRIGHKTPKTIGLGVSFRYNPNKDAYMVVPAAMQTIGVVANCISKEKQGINILAYLQWQIADFAKAYKKLDFSETRDPLGIVNAQLREQAEAAIKDKIATMSVEEVLTDKAPIIQELTNRLKTVAEGQHLGSETSDEGLGIKITTVQIREAIVSSESLWTDLQNPFRNELKKKSRISFLETENEIKQKEFESKLLIETGESKTQLEIELLRQKKMTETSEIRIREEGIRFAAEQQNKQKNTSLEEQTEMLEKESIDRLLAKENDIKLKRDIENISIETRLEETKLEFKAKQIEQETLILEKEAALLLKKENQRIEMERLQYNALIEKQTAEQNLIMKFEGDKRRLETWFDQQKAETERYRLENLNLKNNQVLFSELIRELPKIAAEMPEIHELKILQTGGEDHILNSLINFISKIKSIGESMGINLNKNIEKTE